MNFPKKQYKYLYKKMCEKETIRKAFWQMAKGSHKSKNKEICAIKRNLEYCVEKMEEMLENTKPEGIYVEHPELSFMPEEKEPVTIMERGKERKLYKPSIIEQWVHNIILVVTEHIFRKMFYNNAYGCAKEEKKNGKKKRRPRHMRTVENWIHLGFKYFLKLDIRHCYNSIKTDMVMECLSGFICDDYAMNLIRRCFLMYKDGNAVGKIDSLPLGFRLSPWLCSVYLTELDKEIISTQKEKMYLRYVDDMIVCGNNKKDLHKVLIAIKIKLGKMRLRLKDNWQLCRFDYEKKSGKTVGRPVDIMGFKFYRNKTILRKHIIYRMERIAHKIKNSKRVYYGHAMSICSSMGYILHTDCYRWYEEMIKPYVKIKKMKKIVSKYNKKSNCKKEGNRNDGMENGNMRKRKTGRTGICFA